jgi:hypothetical protein
VTRGICQPYHQLLVKQSPTDDATCSWWAALASEFCPPAAVLSLHHRTPQAARLWVHECERVFRDRMVSDTDMAKFDEFRSSVTKKFFEDLGLQAVEERPLLFTSFMQVIDHCFTAS